MHGIFVNTLLLGGQVLSMVISLVKGVGTVMLSLALSLSNTLLVPFLSHKLIYVSQITKELNCTVLIYPEFCLIHDILLKEIIGHGTKKGGSTMDDFIMGRAHHVGQPSDTKSEQIWLWH